MWKMPLEGYANDKLFISTENAIAKSTSISKHVWVSLYTNTLTEPYESISSPLKGTSYGRQCCEITRNINKGDVEESHGKAKQKSHRSFSRTGVAMYRLQTSNRKENVKSHIRLHPA